jgi:hypothetical protein
MQNILHSPPDFQYCSDKLKVIALAPLTPPILATVYTQVGLYYYRHPALPPSVPPW